MLRSTLLLAALAALLVSGLVRAAEDAPADAFLVARKWAGEPESEGLTVVGRRVPITTEIFNAGSK